MFSDSPTSSIRIQANSDTVSWGRTAPSLHEWAWCEVPSMKPSLSTRPFITILPFKTNTTVSPFPGREIMRQRPLDWAKSLASGRLAKSPSYRPWFQKRAFSITRHVAIFAGFWRVSLRYRWTCHVPLFKSFYTPRRRIGKEEQKIEIRIFDWLFKGVSWALQLRTEKLRWGVILQNDVDKSFMRQIYAPPNEDFGRLNKPFSVCFPGSTFQGCENPIWATKRWQVLRKRTPSKIVVWDG